MQSFNSKNYDISTVFAEMIIVLKALKLIINDLQLQRVSEDDACDAFCGIYDARDAQQ